MNKNEMYNGLNGPVNGKAAYELSAVSFPDSLRLVLPEPNESGEAHSKVTITHLVLELEERIERSKQRFWLMMGALYAFTFIIVTLLHLHYRM